MTMDNNNFTVSVPKAKTKAKTKAAEVAPETVEEKTTAAEEETKP